MKLLAAILASLVASLFVFSVAFAQESNGLKIFVPKVMIAGNEYSGLIIGNSDLPKVVIISSSDPNVLETSQSVTVLPNHKQQTFALKAVGTGPATITAMMNDASVSAQTTLYAPDDNAKKSLDLVFIADQTSIPDLVGFVYAFDGGLPTLVGKDVDVALSSAGGKATYPQKIKINKGTTGSSFDVIVNGDAKLFADSESYGSDSGSISYVNRDVSVALDVGPVIMMENSIGYAVVSFVEDGHQFIPAESVKVTIHSSNTKIVSVDAAIPAKGESKTIYVGENGIALVKLFTHQAGSSILTVDAPGYGSTSSNVFVGPAKLGSNQVSQNGTVQFTPLVTKDFADKNANTILGWVFPKINSGFGYLISGLYYSEDDVELTISADGIQRSTTVTLYYPVTVNNAPVYVTSKDAKHDSQLILGNGERPSNMGMTEISAPEGSRQISLTSPGIPNSATVPMVSTKQSNSDYSIRITPLPVKPGYVQEVAVVGVIDKNGVMIDPHKIGKDLKMHVTSSVVEFDENDFLFDFGLPYKVLTGYVKSAGKISVTADGLNSGSAEVFSSSSNRDSFSVKIFMPDEVYSGEPFSAYAYVLDSFGNPAESLDLVPLGNCHMVDSNFVCAGKGSLSATSDVGTAQEAVNIMYSTFDDASVDITNMNVGGIYEINVGGVEGAKITVDSAIPHKVDGSRITLSPGKAGEFDVVISIEGDGFLPKTISKTVSVADQIDVDLSAKDPQGNELVVDVAIDTSGQTLNKKTPIKIPIERGNLRIEFSKETASNSRNIVFDWMSVNGGRYDQNSFSVDATDASKYGTLSITANYVEKYSLTVDGQTEMYAPGQNAIIHPPPSKPKFSFLTWDIFDHWSGADSASLSPFGTDGTMYVMMVKNIQINSVYREDWTNLAIFAAVLVVIILLVLYKNDSEKLLKFFQIFDTIKSKLPRRERESGDVYREKLAKEERPLLRRFFKFPKKPK
jgi:hypothetical protein